MKQSTLILATLAAAVAIMAKAKPTAAKLSSSNASTGTTGDSIYSLSGMLPTADPWYSMTSLARQLEAARTSNTNYLTSSAWML